MDGWWPVKLGVGTVLFLIGITSFLVPIGGGVIWIGGIVAGGALLLSGLVELGTVRAERSQLRRCEFKECRSEPAYSAWILEVHRVADGLEWAEQESRELVGLCSDHAGDALAQGLTKQVEERSTRRRLRAADWPHKSESVDTPEPTEPQPRKLAGGLPRPRWKP